MSSLIHLTIVKYCQLACCKRQAHWLLPRKWCFAIVLCGFAEGRFRLNGASNVCKNALTVAKKVAKITVIMPKSVVEVPLLNGRQRRNVGIFVDFGAKLV
ncbi:MAG: hypothetical protein IKA29_00715 [Clostridia bacterium]|nr:hypothetical protein [Clostridia bacterium]